MHQALHDIFVFLAAACLIVPLSSRLKLGSVIGYLLAGIIIGPHALKLISTNANVSHIAEFGVVMMLFLIGLELEPAALWRLRKFIIGLGGLQVLLTTALFFTLGRALGVNWQQSLIVGAALSLSSTALVLQMLKEKEQLSTQQGQSAFSILLFQDIAVIPLLVIMPLLSLKGGQIDSETNAIDHLSGLTQVFIILGVIITLIVFGRFFSYFFFREIAKTKLREIFTSVSLALIVGITLLMQLIGISPALGAFIAGVVLANSHYKHTLETDIEPFKGLLLGLFFISVGMGIDFIILKEKFLWILLAVTALITVKFIVIYALARLFKFARLTALGFGLTLAQGGEFAFVLFQYAGNFSIILKEN